MLKLLTTALLAAAALALAAPGQAAETGSFRFTGWDGPALTIHYAAPDNPAPDAKIVIVIHGVRRNADEYRDNWIALADRYGFIVAAPEFAEDDFPGSAAFQTGGVIGPDGAAAPVSDRAFAAIEPLFDAVKRRWASGQTGYALFGHSAGAQFVHRFILFTPKTRVTQWAAANAGWYTLPDFDTAWPYGLKGAPIGRARLIAALETPGAVMLGAGDDDPNADYLRKTEEAEAQGPHRLARGIHFYDSGRLAARTLDARFAWRLSATPGIAHDNRAMARQAAAYFARPLASTLPRGQQ